MCPGDAFAYLVQPLQAGVRLRVRVGGGVYLAIHRDAVVARWIRTIDGERHCVTIEQVHCSP